jgi:hypothetical protein
VSAISGNSLETGRKIFISPKGRVVNATGETTIKSLGRTQRNGCQRQAKDKGKNSFHFLERIRLSKRWLKVIKKDVKQFSEVIPTFVKILA